MGARGADFGTGYDQGAAYVYVRSGTSWTQQAQLAASDGATVDYFGRSLAISGDTIVVGADQAEVPGVSDAGAAYVFES